MKRARKSNRVSWAPGPNLCQVRLFLSDECPSKVGLKSQDHLQAKTLSPWPSSTDDYDDLPPGFEGNHFMNQSKAEPAQIAQIKWKCPRLFACSYDWCVAAGEESTEKDNQKLREMRVLEAVYPRLSDIPPSPFVPYEVEKEDYDDNLTALIPILPIEEEESMDILPEVAVTKHADTPTNLLSQNMPLPEYMPAATSLINSQCKSTSTTVPSDLAAASAAVAAIMKSNEHGSLIDTDLLLTIFNDPTMIGKLINEHRTAAATVGVSSNTLAKPTSELKPVVSSVPLSKPIPEAGASRTRPSTTGGILPPFGPKQTTPLESLSDKPAISPVSVLTSIFDKPSTPSVPFFRPVSVPIPPPPPPPPSTPHIHRPANKEIPHMSNGVRPSLNTYPPQQHTVLSSAVTRSSPLPSVSSSELSTVALPSTSGNFHAVTNQVRSSTVRTVPYQPGTGAVKDANYYKNLIRQHGTDKQQDMPDSSSQIGIRDNNFQDLKSVNNIVKPILKTEKPCIYFKSSRGCRNGSSCPYKHDTSVQLGGGNVLVTQNAKRVKLGPEIKGWI